MKPVIYADSYQQAHPIAKEYSVVRNFFESFQWRWTDITEPYANPII